MKVPVGLRRIKSLVIILFACAILGSRSGELLTHFRLNTVLLWVSRTLVREFPSFNPLEHLFAPVEPPSACEVGSSEIAMIRNFGLESKNRAVARHGVLLLIRCGRPAQAEQLLESVELDGHSRMLLAIAYGQQGSADLALETLRTVPRSADALMRAGVRVLSQGGDTDVGLRLLEWSRSLDNRVSASKAPMYLALAEVYRRGDEPDKSIYYLKLLTSVTPSDPHPFVRLGAIYVWQKKPLEAIAALSRAEDLGGREDRQFPGILGQAYEMIEQWDSAENEYREALRLGPEYLRTRLHLARVLCKQGRFAEALAHLDPILQSGDVAVVSEAEALKDHISKGNCP